MNILLEDSGFGIWLLGVTNAGVPNTTPSSGAVTSLILLEDINNLAWQVGVDPSGALFTGITATTTVRRFITLTAPNGTLWRLFVNTSGVLQTTPIFNIVWVQNGFGAGTDNSVVGGDGGFMSYPQPPPDRIFMTPEANALCGPIDFAYDSSTSTAKGNIFVVSNPGSNG